jgi:hypothetical protein
MSFFEIFFANYVLKFFFLLIRIENVLFSIINIFELEEKNFFQKNRKKLNFLPKNFKGL